MRIAVRADASRAIGWGHVKRCRAVADALCAAGAEVRFFGRAAEFDVAALLQGSAARFVAMPAAGPCGDDAADTLAAFGSWRPHVVLVDHYRLDARWHTALRTATGARLAAIDDLADRPLDVDLLIDHNPAADHRAKYAGVLPATVPICGGPGYALLDAVYARTPARPWRDTVRSIGIFIGGTDALDHSRWALQALRRHAQWHGPVEVATTSANPHRAALQALQRTDGALMVSVDRPHLADFHTAHDLQVGAGGGALWERCALGVPTLALICAANQRQSVPLLADAGAVVGFDATALSPEGAAELGAALARLIDSPASRARLRERSLALVDGRGAHRAAQALLALLPAVADAGRRQGTPAQGQAHVGERQQAMRVLPAALTDASDVQLRPATLADAERLLAWRNDDDTRAASHATAAVSAPEHHDWLLRSLADPQRRLWLAWRGTEPVGTVRADRPAGAAETTLSWTVAPAARGGGIGRAMVALAARQLRGPLRAEVKVGNRASARIAEAAGLRCMGEAGGDWHFQRTPR